MSKGKNKGFTPDWRPIEKSRVLLEQVDEVFATYEHQLPLTVRQIFYRMVATYDYPKTESASNSLGELLVMARRSGRIPFEWIRDDGEASRIPLVYASAGEFSEVVFADVERYRRDRQAGQPVYIELWCEAAGAIGTVADAAAEHGVPTFSGGGQPSVTVKHKTAKRIASRAVPTLVLQVGDHDPSGESIYGQVDEDIALLAAGLGGVVSAERIAITPEQAKAINAPSRPPNPKDNNTKSWSGGDETWQAEALPPDALAEIVSEAILDNRDARIAAKVLRAEKRDRASLRKRYGAESV